jgi:hypothetical protein
MKIENQCQLCKNVSCCVLDGSSCLYFLFKNFNKANNVLPILSDKKECKHEYIVLRRSLINKNYTEEKCKKCGEEIDRIKSYH